MSSCLKKIVSFLAILLLTACSTPAVDEPAPDPWIGSSLDNARDKFTFAIFSDLTGGERPDVFKVAVEQLNLLRPDFIMNVGDLIEGGSRIKAELDNEWDSFDERAARARARIYLTGGNHDLTNTAMREVWQQRYGRSYYHFIHQNVLFLVLDTEDYPPARLDEIDDLRRSAMQRVEAEGWGIYRETPYGQLDSTKSGWVSAEQADYFEQVVNRLPNVRWTFVFMHKPAWERPNEENFLRIEQALQQQAYTVFHGHLHDYQHQQRFQRDYIQLGTTGGVQLAGKQMAVDHITLVTVAEGEPDIANIRLSGLFDKTGRIPLNGEDLCFEAAQCGQ